MFVNLSSRSNSFFTPIVEFIKQQRQIQTLISYIALGTLCAGTVYWIWSYFWQNRRVQKEMDDDLLDLFESAIPNFSKEDAFYQSGEIQPKVQESPRSKQKKTFDQDSISLDEFDDFNEYGIEEGKFNELEIDEYLKELM